MCSIKWTEHSRTFSEVSISQYTSTRIKPHIWIYCLVFISTIYLIPRRSQHFNSPIDIFYKVNKEIFPQKSIINETNLNTTTILQTYAVDLMTTSPQKKFSKRRRMILSFRGYFFCKWWAESPPCRWHANPDSPCINRKCVYRYVEATTE